MKTPLRHAILKALEKIVRDELKDSGEAVVAELTAEGVGRITPMLPDGSKLGTLTIAEPKPKRTGGDLEWVKANVPTAVISLPEKTIPAEEHADPALVEAFLDSLMEMDGEFYTKDGTLVEGVTVTQRKPYASMKFTDEGREAIAAQWRDGSLPMLTAISDD